MPKVKRCSNPHDESWIAFRFHCPGCDEDHAVRTAGDRPGPKWSFNGDIDAPTFEPSIRVTGVQWPTDEEEALIERGETVETRPLCCHSFVRGGRIQFLSDCTHGLAGRVVDLPEIET